MNDEPRDPFHGDPTDPARALDDAFGEEGVREPLTHQEREDALEDLADLEIFRVLLEAVGMRGVVVDCEDCREPHYVDWELMQANLRHMLDVGSTRVHEPPFEPDPQEYVSWEYARGYADGVMRASDTPD